jgi:hypothetical protein
VVRVPGYRFRDPGSIPGATGTGSTQSTQLLGRNSRVSVLKKTVNTAGGIRCTNHATSSIRNKLALASPTSDGRSAGIVRSGTKAKEFVCLLLCNCHQFSCISICFMTSSSFLKVLIGCRAAVVQST